MFERQEAEADVAEKKTEAKATEQQSRAQQELMWNFLGLQIARKTEVIALVAFVLSVSLGAVVRLFPSDQIVIVAANKIGRNYSGQDNLLALIATMSYVNDGDVGHNAVIRREYVSFSFGARDVEHRWYEFGSSDVQDGNFVFKRESEARPFPVNAGSAVSHETLFAAWEVDCEDGEKNCEPRKNFVKWEDFLTATRTNNRFVITTKANIFPTKIVTATCEVRLRDWEITILETEQRLSAACTDVSSGVQAERKAQRRIGPTKKN
jgi:hypothetical protein